MLDRALVEFYFAAPMKCGQFCNQEDKSGALLTRIMGLCDERVNANRLRIAAGVGHGKGALNATQ